MASRLDDLYLDPTVCSTTCLLEVWAIIQRTLSVQVWGTVMTRQGDHVFVL